MKDLEKLFPTVKTVEVDGREVQIKKITVGKIVDISPIISKLIDQGMRVDVNGKMEFSYSAFLGNIKDLFKIVELLTDLTEKELYELSPEDGYKVAEKVFLNNFMGFFLKIKEEVERTVKEVSARVKKANGDEPSSNSSNTDTTYKTSKNTQSNSSTHSWG